MRRTLLHETPRAGAAHITSTLLPGRRSLPRVDARVKGHGCLDWDSTNGGRLARTFRDPTAAGRSAPRDGRGGLRQRRRSPWPPPRSQSPRAPTVFRWGSRARVKRDATLPSAARTFRGRAAALGVSMGIWLPTPPRRRWGKVWARPSPLALRGLARSERDGTRACGMRPRDGHTGAPAAQSQQTPRLPLECSAAPRSPN